jgi:SPP1 gp7 family putative phage head morphogenesis protein
MVSEYDAMMQSAHKAAWEVTQKIVQAAMPAMMNADYDWILTDESAMRFLERSKLLWEEKNGEIISAAKYSLIEGIQAGESYQQLYDRVSETITQVARPMTFVNTEIHRAMESGRVDMYAEVGVTKVQWLTAQDERVRPEHAARDGRIYDLDEALSLMGEPNCRCTLLPVFMDANKKNRVSGWWNRVRGRT